MSGQSSMDQFIEGLQIAVKREVIENYFRERRLIELQIEDFRRRASAVGQIERRLALRYIRLYRLLIDRERLPRLMAILGLDQAPYLDRFRIKKRYKPSVLPFIPPSGLTNRGRYTGLIFRAYGVLFDWNGKYAEAHDDLALEARAVNLNLDKFRSAYDLISIVRFIRSMDVTELERRHFLGQNFTAKELSAIEHGLTFKNVSLEAYGLLGPRNLPLPNAISHDLRELAREIFDRHRDQACELIAWRPVKPAKK